jgi:hypothetical protein
MLAWPPVLLAAVLLLYKARQQAHCNAAKLNKAQQQPHCQAAEQGASAHCVHAQPCVQGPGEAACLLFMLAAIWFPHQQAHRDGGDTLPSVDL